MAVGRQRSFKLSAASVSYSERKRAREYKLATASVVAEEKGQSFDVGEVQNVFAVMDSELLRLALMNLVQNAIRYSPPAKPIRLLRQRAARKDAQL